MARELLIFINISNDKTERLEEIAFTKGVIRIRKSNKYSQHNDQKKKYKRTKNNLQNITHKTKSWLNIRVISTVYRISLRAHFY
jgi:hypothetical protein